MLDYTYLFFEFIAFLCAINSYSKLKQNVYKYFIPYLLYIIVYEICSANFLFNINYSNLWIENITMTISFLYYSFILYNLLQNISLKKWLKLAVVLILSFTIINTAFIQGFWKLDTISILLQYALIIIMVCFFFYELMNANTLTIPIIKLPAFWLNTGLLFFCLLQFLFFTSFAYNGL